MKHIGSRHVLALDLLRFFSAFVVMAYHLCYQIWASGRYTPVENDFRVLIPCTSFGWIGVEIFFLISGFVIALSAGAASPGSFLRGRVLRLVPTAWICGAITATALVAAGAPAVPVVLGYINILTFWPFGGWIDASYWTLGVELCFYALVLILLKLRRLAMLEPVMGALGLISTSYTKSV